MGSLGAESGSVIWSCSDSVKLVHHGEDEGRDDEDREDGKDEPGEPALGIDHGRLSVVLELQGHRVALPLFLEARDHPLQLVLGLAGDANRAALDLTLDLGEVVA